MAMTQLELAQIRIKQSLDPLHFQGLLSLPPCFIHMHDMLTMTDIGSNHASAQTKEGHN